jgi:hypothetical protein
MMKRLNIFLISMVAFTVGANAAPSFHTQCLETIYKVTKIDLPSFIGVNADNDSTWNYCGRTLRIRTNAFGDVSHIGYKLFNSAWARDYDAQPLLDYIERYALELDLKIEGRDPFEEESKNPITFIEGNAKMLSKVTPEDQVTIKEKERRSFIVEWNLGNKKLSIMIPSDYQLFTGANAIELENIFKRDISRIIISIPSDTIPIMWKNCDIYRKDSFLIASNGKYLSDMIRSDIYVKESSGNVKIMIDKKKPLQAVNNILLTGFFNKEIPLDLTIDKYGYVKDHVTTTIQQFITYCQSEGCVLYIGIKSRTDDVVTATLFALNKRMAYNHMLSLSFPLSIINKGEGIVKGTLFAYTPLQNITEKFFINNISIN